MPMVYSILAGHEVDSASEAWRHECECRWLLQHKPTRVAKYLYLFGVVDRNKLFIFNTKTGRSSLAEKLTDVWQTPSKPLMHWRGLAGADKILADARILHEHNLAQKSS